ncbi:MAG: hypothetical protein JW866_11100 [Ignavibacteriales bacterium]|nr:hypothetical protein [Ignavibacteriales bacterium]
MTKVLLEKMIIEETKGLPFQTLNEILDFIQFIKAKKIKNRVADSLENDITIELSELNTVSLMHLEEEFSNYKELYPHE